MSRALKSIEEHLLHGSKPQNVIPAVSSVPGGRPKAPRHLCPDALAEFKRISKILGARKTETPGDYSALAVYSEVYSRWVEAKRVLAAEGLMIDITVTDSNGAAHSSRRLNPLIRVVENCEGRLLALAKAMGLTPDSRDKVRPLKPPKPTMTEEEQRWNDLENRRGPRVVPMPKPPEESENEL